MVTDVELCSDVAPGMELRSMQASWISNLPGSCQAAGGEPIGTVTPKGPRRFCCQPAPGE
jgi:hypothetical protein